MSRTLLLIIGVLFALAGFYSVFLNPFPASFAAAFIAAWSFIILGVVQIFAAFSLPTTGRKIGGVILGAAAALAGLVIVADPLKGVIALSIVVGIMFLVSGIAKVILGFSFKLPSLRWMLVLSGAASAILGFMIFSDFPVSAVTILGVLLGVELLLNGIVAIVVALNGHKEAA